VWSASINAGLLKKAKENAPCLVFIDEIDAVGRQRGAGIGGVTMSVNSNPQPVTYEMDGFGNTGIIIIALLTVPMF